MSVVHIFTGDDWMRIPHAEVRRVRFTTESRVIPPNTAGAWSGTFTLNTTTYVVYVLAITLASGAVLTVETGTPIANVFEQMRQDLFLHTIDELDICWTFNGTAWQRTFGRPEITDPAYLQNA